MKTLLSLTILFSFLFSATISAEGFYKWKDARGNIQYGDKPPANNMAERIDLPKLTVIDNYADQWKPLKFEGDQQSLNNQQPQQQSKKPSGNTYSKLAFIAPKAGQSIRANDGDVSAMLSIKPPLKKGHEIAFFIDGKEVAKGTARTNNFANLNRGAHTISAKIIDKKGRELKSSSVSFNVQRFSKLIKRPTATPANTSNN